MGTTSTTTTKTTTTTTTMTTTTTTTLTTTPTTTTTKKTCTDSLSCKLYSEGWCPYYAFIRKSCPKLCKLCNNVAPTPQPLCEDAFPLSWCLRNKRKCNS